MVQSIYSFIKGIRKVALLYVYILPFVLCHAASAQERSYTAYYSFTLPAVFLSKEDTIYVRKLLQLSDSLRYLNRDSALSVLTIAIDTSKRLGYYGGVAEAKMKYGQVVYLGGDYIEGKEHIAEAYYYCLNAGQDKKKMLALWYNNMSGPYSYLGNYDSAAALLLKGLQIVRQINDTSLMIRSYINLGAVLGNSGNYASSLYYLHKAEELAHYPGYSLYNAHLYYNLAVSHGGANDTLIQQLYGHKALKASREFRDLRMEILSLHTLGSNALYLRQFDEAIKYFEQAKELSGDRMPYYSFLAVRGMSQVYSGMNNLAKAKSTGIEALRLAAQTDLVEKTVSMQNYLVADILHRLKEDSAAYYYLNEYVQLNEKVNNIERNKTIDYLEVKNKVLEKDRVIALKELEVVRQNMYIRTRNTWVGIAALGMVMVLTVLFGFYYRTRKKMQLLEKEDEIRRLKAVMTGEEKERSRIARELHDGIGSLVSAAGINLNTLGDDNEELVDQASFKKTEDLIAEISAEVRKTAHNLMPEILLQHDLPEAVKLFCSYLQKEKRPAFEVQVYGDFQGLTKDFQLAVYRIIQELVQNIIKHSKASNAIVQLHADQNLLSVTVEDNGEGYDPAVLTGQGMGLGNIDTRVKVLNGRISVDTGVGKGTSVYIEFDL